MRRIEFKDLLEYTICPYKLSFSSEEKAPSIEDVYREVYRYLFKKSFLEITVSFDKLYRFFNHKWSSFKSQTSPKLNADYLHNISSRIRRIHEVLDFSSCKVIAFDYPVFYETEDLLIAGSIDAIVYESKTKTIRAIYLHKSISGSLYDNVEDLLLNIFLRVSTYKIDKYTVETDVVNLTSNTSKRVFSQNVLRCKNLLKGYSQAYLNKAVYPVPSKLKCKSCSYKELCEWAV